MSKQYDLTVRAAATYLGISVATVYTMVAAEEITCLRVRGTKCSRIRFAVEDLEEWKDRNLTIAKPLRAEARRARRQPPPATIESLMPAVRRFAR